MHTSSLDMPGIGPVPSNGLLVVDGDHTLLVDTAWTEQQTALVLRWARQVLAKPVQTAVVTHAHQDKMGGIAELHRAGIDSWAHPLTNEEAPKNGFERVRNTFTFDANGWASGAGAAALAPLKVYFPGGAHTRDNITVALPALGIAFGGCMIKGSDSTSLGNLDDADLAAYEQSVRNFSAAFPDAGLIVMSHSPPETRDAINRTLELAATLQPH
jgi:glyoxylase-like metal-dependent hydrolase (beta-lactamase superfamily II)